MWCPLGTSRARNSLIRAGWPSLDAYPTTPSKGHASHAHLYPLDRSRTRTRTCALRSSRCGSALRPDAERRSTRRDGPRSPRVGRLRYRPPVLHLGHRLSGQVGRAALVLHTHPRQRPPGRHPRPRPSRRPPSPRGQRPRARRAVLRRAADAPRRCHRPTQFTGPWGLDRPLVDGEQVEAVGHIGRSHTDESDPPCSGSTTASRSTKCSAANCRPSRSTRPTRPTTPDRLARPPASPAAVQTPRLPSRLHRLALSGQGWLLHFSPPSPEAPCTCAPEPAVH